MKIAIVDHMVNYGGGSRVLRNLLPAIKKLRPDWTLVFYCNQASIERDGLRDELSPYLDIKGLKSAKLANLKLITTMKGGKTIVHFFQRKFRKFLAFFPYFFSGALHKEIEDIAKNCDLIFCPWPYLIECPILDSSIPVVSIFHDFNFRYYFNGPTIHPVHLDCLNQEIPRWLNLSTPVVSTHFMKRELEKFYPEFGPKTNVIHLSSLVGETDMDLCEAKKIVEFFGIFGPYLFYPTNTSTHKNIGNLLTAFYLLGKKYTDLKLVLAGFGTEVVNGHVNSFGLEIGMDHRDVIGLGYVTNMQVDALIQCAQVVVSTSLYEAGCGPGLDAWKKGVPVAMSNIAPFTEHLEVQGVKAQIFDPKSPADIAEKIESILSNPQQAKMDAMDSQKKLAQYDWSCVAQKYINVFEKTFKILPPQKKPKSGSKEPQNRQKLKFRTASKECNGKNSHISPSFTWQ
ncbi:MAG TPA: glycosyltransferase [Chlamydiales bacterium]|nr:glycosyltransferase [Chlamydiales bacterium]